MTRKSTSSCFGRGSLTGWLFLTPLIVMVGALAILPVCTVIWNSLSYEGRYVGLTGFAELFGDPRALESVLVTVKFVVISVSIEMFAGILIALLLEKDTLNPFMRKVLIISLLFPMILPYVVTGVIWSLLLDDTFGAINFLLGLVGLGPFSWLGDPSIALYSVIIMSLVTWTPFIAIVTYSGLLALPRFVKEAARLDGCSELQLFRYVVFPLLTPFLLIALLLRLADAFKAFDEVITMTGGGPANVTELMSIFIYRLQMKEFNTQYAAVMGIVLLAIVVALSVPVIQRLRRI